MKSNNMQSAFNELGFPETIRQLIDTIKTLYKNSKSPWIIGYSGGKDSSTVAQLVWNAVAELESDERENDVHIISTDTLVENPVVADWVAKNLEKMQNAAEKQNLPIYTHRLTPTVKDSFWVNLIGKGYPAPRPLFRWCTSRLKINPSNKFISDIVSKSGEAILALGMRKAESATRARVMKKIEEKRVHDLLTPNQNLPNSHVFTPIEDWTNDDVWAYLLNNHKAPWGFDNNEILDMYKGASPDNECPLVVDSGTQSCGNSRFGCWVCTLVNKDSSMEAMIQNDHEKEWMKEMMSFRDELDIKNDRQHRDFRKIDGKLMLHNRRLVHGPYKQYYREQLLEKLLKIQKNLASKKSKNIPDIEMISMEELKEIRRIWLHEKHEIEDNLPEIYESIMKKPFPGKDNKYWFFGKNEMQALKEVCGDDEIHFEMIRSLLSIERKFSFKVKRAGLYEELDKTVKKHFFENEDDALELALKVDNAKKNAKEGRLNNFTFIESMEKTSKEEELFSQAVE